MHFVSHSLLIIHFHASRSGRKSSSVSFVLTQMVRHVYITRKTIAVRLSKWSLSVVSFVLEASFNDNGIFWKLPW